MDDINRIGKKGEMSFRFLNQKPKKGKGKVELLPIADAIREAETTPMVKSVLAIGLRPSKGTDVCFC